MGCMRNRVDVEGVVILDVDVDFIGWTGRRRWGDRSRIDRVVVGGMTRSALDLFGKLERATVPQRSREVS